VTEASEPRDADGQLHGFVVKLYPWGALDSEVEYVHGVMHGAAREYHANGKLKSEGMHAAGERHGAARQYDDEGRLVEEASYSRGDLDGRILRYRSVDGAQALVESVEMRAGKRHGESRTFTDQGVLIELTTYADDELNGPRQHYFDDGTPSRFEEWRAGTLHGLELDFFVNGARRTAAFRDMGRLHGPVLSYHGNGRITGVAMYWQDQATPDLTLARPWLLQHSDALGVTDVEALIAPEAGGEFYPNGQRMAQYTLVAGVREGPYSIFRKDGRVSEQGTYRAGKLDGEVRSFHENDAVHLTGTFAAGAKHGRESEHDENGQLLWEKEWSGGAPLVETTYHLNGHVKRELRRGADGAVDAKWYDDAGNIAIAGSLRADPKRRWRTRTSLEDELDLPIGVHRRWWPTGMLAWEQAFEGGRAHGPAKVYDWEGLLLYDETFTDGVLTRRVTYATDGSVRRDETFFADGSRKVGGND
jgi:antitoxin component YwqK of YwqJK toxin-antitoxin module